MNLKKYTCPRCGSEDELLITSPKKESPVKYLIWATISSFIALIPASLFLVNYLNKNFKLFDGTFWLSLVLCGIPLFLSIFFFAKWLNSKNEEPMEECVCKKCGNVWLETPPIENNQND